MQTVNKYSPYLFIVILILSIQVSSDIILDSLVFKAILISLLIAIWGFVLLISNKHFKFHFDRDTLFGLFFVIYYGASVLWSNTYTLSVFSASKLILFFVLFSLLNSLLKQDNNVLELLIKAIILSFLLSLFSFVKQILLLNELTYTSIYSLSGISGHKNLYSSFVFLTLIGSFIGLQYLKKQRFWHILVICTLILQVTAILILRTRTVWLACLVSGGIYALLSISKKIRINVSKVWRYSILIAASATIFIAFALPLLINLYSSLQLESSDISVLTDVGTFSERVMVWDKTFELVKENLYLGVGAGNWKLIVSKYSLPQIYKVQDLNVVFQSPHNEYLKILSENGIFGLFLFTFLLVYFSLGLFNPNSKLDRKTSNYIFSGFIGFYIIMFFSFPLERIEHGLIITFLLCISNLLANKNPKASGLNLHKGFLGISLLICLALFFVFQSRYKSSFYLKKMYYERNIGNDEKVLDLCDSAISALTKTDDFSVPIHWYRGNANANMGNFKAALQDFKLAYTYHPYNAHVLNDLGSAYFMNSNTDSAIFFYEKSTMINPRFDDPKLNLVAIFINEGDLRNAKKWEDTILHESERRIYYKELIDQMEKAIQLTD